MEREGPESDDPRLHTKHVGFFMDRDTSGSQNSCEQIRTDEDTETMVLGCDIAENSSVSL